MTYVSKNIKVYSLFVNVHHVVMELLSSVKASPWHQQAGRKDAGQQLAKNAVLR